MARRQPQWRELEDRLRSVRRGALRGVDTAELERIAILYRHAASDLAIARRDFPGADTTEYLNALCARVNPLLQRGEPAHWGGVLNYFAVDIPRRWRAAWRYMLASVVFCVIVAVIGFVVGDNELTGHSVAAQNLVDESLYGLEIQTVVTAADINGFQTALMIILNNILVTFILFMGGITVGLLTAYELATNFWMVGVLTAAAHVTNEEYVFVSYLAAHGVIELSIIMAAGGCGFMIGDGLLRPGMLSRGEALVAATSRAFGLAGGLALVLIVCGTIEGYLSPSTASPAAKYMVGAVSGVLLYSWLFLSGRQRHRRYASLDTVTPTASSVSTASVSH